MHFLHTARPNVRVFSEWLERLAPGEPAHHLLLETVLNAAVGSGVLTDDMRRETEAALDQLVREGASIIVCTCSTIGGIAEAAVVPQGVTVLRIDRPMAEAAVASGRRIIVAATLSSTLKPTLALIADCAAAAGRAPDVVELLCESAWPHFQRGDLEGYAGEITRAVRGVATEADVVVLAQASMAPAAPLLNGMGVLAFSSPELGIRAALARIRR